MLPNLNNRKNEEVISDVYKSSLVNQIQMRKLSYLVGYSGISVILLFLGGWLTYLGLGDWYYSLDFPPYQPPSWVFTPAWVIVLSCLAVSTWLVVCKAEENLQSALSALTLYGAQCVLNVGWSLLFFTMQRPDIALWELVALDATLLGMMLTYGRASRWAALLLLPYAGWLILSTAINIWIVMHNDFPILNT